jgi:hypothetical protein
LDADRIKTCFAVEIRVSTPQSQTFTAGLNILSPRQCRDLFFAARICFYRDFDPSIIGAIVLVRWNFLVKEVRQPKYLALKTYSVP